MHAPIPGAISWYRHSQCFTSRGGENGNASVNARRRRGLTFAIAYRCACVTEHLSLRKHDWPSAARATLHDHYFFDMFDPHRSHVISPTLRL
jgi:hypothetical protein